LAYKDKLLVAPPRLLNDHLIIPQVSKTSFFALKDFEIEFKFEIEKCALVMRDSDPKSFHVLMA
jgi:hypothetical protein